MKSLVKFCALALLVAVHAPASQAQTYENYNWYFGDLSQAIQFDRGTGEPSVIQLDLPPTPVRPDTVHTTIANDPLTGSVLFYANTDKAYDASNQVMNPSFNFAASGGSNQAILAFPAPNSSTQYFIIAKVNDSNSLFYYRVDMSERNQNNEPSGPPLGQIVNNPVNIPVTSPSEGLTAIQGPDRVWLLVQSGNRRLIIMEFDETGMINTNTLDLPSDLRVANFAYSDVVNKVALSPQSTSGNVQIYDFDPASGQMTYDTTVFNSGFNDGVNENIYDTEWSNDGTKLYISRYGGNNSTGNVYQYDFTIPNFSLTSVLPAPVFESLGLQAGPDGNIYHLFRDSPTDIYRVGRIVNVDSLSNIVEYERNVFGNQVDFRAKQFPYIAPPYDTTSAVNFTYLDSCENSRVKFFPNIEPDASVLAWDFGDDSFSNAHSPIHSYESAGTYTVRLAALINGQIDTLRQEVNIIANQDSVYLGQDTTICPGETLTLSNRVDAGPPYVWSTGEAGQEIQVDSSGTYWLAAGPCGVYDEIEITVYGDEEQSANQWYFGDEAGIDFNNGANALTDGQMTTPEGAATISDQNGDLLFYTDGQNVYNREHELIADDLAGDPGSTQSSIIIPFANDATMYYIFTTREIFNSDNRYELFYSVMDMKYPPHGKLTIKNQKLFSNSTERITAAGTDDLTWLVAHEYGNNAFRTYAITEDGISAPIISNIGSIHRVSDELNGQGYMKFAQDGSRVAVALANAGSDNDIIEIFDFADTTGRLSNPIAIDIPDEGDQRVYGVEFSRNSEKLFATISGSTSRVIEVFVDTSAVDVIQNSLTDLNGDVTGQLGAIQVGPDGTFYVAIEGSQALGTIQPIEDFEQVSSYNDGIFDLAGRTSRLGLPNFIQTNVPPSQQPSITFTDNCLGQSTAFQGQGTSIIDEYFWAFGDGNSATGMEASHTYTNDSVYLVSLNITNRCGLDTTLSREINIFQEAPSPTISDTTFCRGDQLVLNANLNAVSDLSFNWTNGDTTNITILTERGNIGVTITDENGCTAEETIEVGAGGPEINLGPDRTYCQGDNAEALDTQDAIASYQWYENGTLNNNTSSTQNVSTSVTGTITYIAAGTDPELLSGCTNSDTVTITVQPSPQVSNVTQVADSCGSGDGILEITLAGSNEVIYSWTGPGGYTNDSSRITNLASGTYRASIQNVSSGCTLDTALAVDDIGDLFEISDFTVTPSCDNDASVTINLSAAGNPYNYNFTDVGTGTLIVSSSVNASTVTIDNLRPGSYLFDIEEQGCTEDTTIEISEPARLSVEIDGTTSTGCDSDTLTLSSSPTGATIEWTTDNGLILSDIDQPQIRVGASGNYFVTVSDNSGSCPGYDTIRVTVSDAPNISITQQGDPCEGSVELLSALTGGAGPFTYRWNNGQSTENLTVTQNGSYSLTLADRSSGCVVTSDPVDINSIQEPFTVNITSDPLCQNDTVLLRANTTVSNASFQWYQNFSAIDVESQDFRIGPLDSTLNNATFTVEATVGGCTEADTLTIRILSATPTTLTSPLLFCPEDPDSSSVTLNAGSGYARYQWTLPNGTMSSSPVLTTSQPGTYRAQLTNAQGCQVTSVVEVIAQCTPEVVAPTAFKPSSNVPQNRAFRIVPIFVDRFEIQIFNQWGEIIFRSNQADFEWFGTKADGTLAPAGTYSYVIRYNGITDTNDRRKQGIVTLIR